MRSVIIYMLLLCVLVPVSGCSSGDELKNKIINYRNNEFGFSLTFPENWSNYRVFSANDYTDTGTRVRVLYFCLPSRSRGWYSEGISEPYAVIFSVYVFTKESWELYPGKKHVTPEDDTVLGRSGSYVFILRYPPSLPVDLYLYMKEIDTVAKTFRINE